MGIGRIECIISLCSCSIRVVWSFFFLFVFYFHIIFLLIKGLIYFRF